MIALESLKTTLCDCFCTELSVQPVPCGFAISTAFTDRSGDRIGCYLVAHGNGYRIEDDGDYLARLAAAGLQIDHGQRGQMLTKILEQSQATWNPETYEIYTPPFSEQEIGARTLRFLTALLRVRDLELLTQEMIRSTFREDATAAIRAEFGDLAEFEENAPVDLTMNEFPCDLVIRPKHTRVGRPGAVYFVSSNAKLNEALLAHMEADKLDHRNFHIFALIETMEKSNITLRVFQRAQNRLLSMPIYRGDETAAVRLIGRELELNRAA